MKISLIIFVAIIVVAVSIFEEQAGEFDWSMENIGRPKQSIFSGPNIFIVSDQGVLTRLNAGNGMAKWRVVLPKKTTVLHIVLIATKLYTLASNSDITGAILSSWSAELGSLEWELLLTPPHQIYPSLSSTPYISSDLLYDTFTSKLRVLYRNSLFFVEEDGNLAWSWAPAPSDYKGVVNAGLELVLSRLAVPLSTTATVVITEQSRAAVGCFVRSDKETISARCEKTAIVTVDSVGRTASLSAFLGLPLPPSCLCAVMTTSAHPINIYDPADILFGVTEPGSVAVLYLKTGKVQILPLSTSGEQANAHVLSQLLMSEDGDLVPVVTTQTASGATAYSLSLEGAMASLHQLVTCSGDAAVLGSQRDPMHALLASSIVCAARDSVREAAVKAAPDQDSFVVSSAFLKSRTAVATQATTRFAASSAFFPSFFLISSGRPRVITPSVSSQTLLVSSSGLTVLLTTPQFTGTASVGQASVRWRRDEGLARVQHTLLVDNTAVDVRGASDGSPDVSLRMQMQLEELQLWANLLVDIAKEVPAVLSANAQTILTLLPGYKSINAAGSGLPFGAVSGSTKAAHRRVLRLAKQQRAHSLSQPSTAAFTGRELTHRKFGFKKTAVCLLSDIESATLHDISDGNGFNFDSANLRLVGLDTSNNGGILWSLEPLLPEASRRVLWIRLLEGAVLPLDKEVAAANKASSHVSLLAATAGGAMYVWVIDTHSGLMLGSSCASKGFEDATASGAVAYRRSLPTSSAVLADGFVAESLQKLALKAPVTVATVDEEALSSIEYVLIARKAEQTRAVILTSDFAKIKAYFNASQPIFLHTVESRLGYLQSFHLDMSSCAFSHSTGDMNMALTTCMLREVASTAFPVNEEAIVSVVYPGSNELTDSRFNVLGDDSVLLKYINPNSVLLVTVSPPQAKSDPSVCEAAHVDPPACRLTVTLIDTVSAKVIYRLAHDNGMGPVHATLIENMIVYSYWNMKAKRTEVSAVGLFEGMVDKYGLTPFASAASAAQAQVIRVSEFSSFTSTVPLGVQKTYVLPKTVTAMHHTVSRHGLANKNVLFCLSPGQLFSVDLRQIHPRRPLAEPSVPEKEEGLFQYTPFAMLIPQQAVTLEQALGGGIKRVVAASSALESTTLVLCSGGLDLFFNRVQSSGGFDLLASDFNHALLVLILSVLAAVVLLLRRMYNKKTLALTWA